MAAPVKFAVRRKAAAAASLVNVLRPAEKSVIDEF